jgi:hypothetical protein
VCEGQPALVEDLGVGDLDLVVTQGREGEHRGEPARLPDPLPARSMRSPGGSIVRPPDKPLRSASQSMKVWLRSPLDRAGPDRPVPAEQMTEKETTA